MPILETHHSKPTRGRAWGSLPAEIRLTILESLTQRQSGWGAYASVCKEWQAVLEKESFRRLKLRTSCLDDMENLIGSRQQRLVKRIWLNIELRPYTCRSCQTTESYTWICGNNVVVRKALVKLFSILCRWPLVDGDGLTLELSIQSPSDKEHYFKNLYFGAHGEDESFAMDDSAYRLPNLTTNNPDRDSKHGWINGNQVDAPSEMAILRIFEPIGLVFNEGLPPIHAVTQLVLRRQCRRQLEPQALGYLLDKFPRLQSVVFESWQRWDRLAQELIYDRGYRKLIESHLPPTMKRISLFEETNEDYAALLRQRSPATGPDIVRVASPAVSAALASRSLGLEKLSAAFVVEARDFLQSYQRDWVWKHLRSLILTSRILTFTAGLGAITSLFRDAAKAALSMPSLHTLVLWNGMRGLACKFFYHIESACASIGWRGTWDLKLEDGVLQDWTKVAHTYTRHGLQIKQEPRILAGVDSHAHAIELLDLPCGVIDPVSSLQIRRETAPGWHQD